MMNTLRTMVVSAAVMLVSSIMTVSAQDEIVIDGSTTVGPIAKAFAEYFMDENEGVNVTVSESGSGNGIKSLINGDCDIGQSSRFMTDGEFAAAVDNGVTPIAHVVALDGIAPVVHPANPVQELSLDELRDIYAGKIRNWREVGGPDREIVAISRDTNSGTYGVWSNVVMRGTDMASHVEYVGSNGAIRSRVKDTKAALGFVGLGFLDRALKGVKVNGVEPTPATTATGEFPIARPLFFFTDGYPELGSTLHRFVNLYQTPTGQQLVEGLGFVPVTHY